MKYELEEMIEKANGCGDHWKENRVVKRLRGEVASIRMQS
jgi:hypothetical protein